MDNSGGVLDSDESISIAYLPDPVALELDPDYPSPAVRQRLLHESSMQFRQITCVELLDGILERGKFNILCVPGGFAPHLDARLGVLGADIIRRFVSGGGGYVGICAGAFFGIMLELLPLEARDIDHCGSPSGPCRLLFSPIGQCVLGAESDEVTVRYHNGPLFRPLNSAVYSLATFRTDFRGRSFPMMDSPAAVCGMHGLGLVVLISPHIEDGACERSHAPFRNIFRFCHTCSQASLHSQHSLDAQPTNCLQLLAEHCV
uniref:Biotin-protein ligase N-terminal domain-containing protein n=1 Tax=Chrysotila carterae TaxID=13221 RepID=A0A7S4C193_CHRCT|mmetsp:Transcript_38318/g.80489  ORF Transcript_38318/g.80489 Transcript_38318/m.80489 type:complete len:260 (+) Transcript_38318:88-867(+)